MPADLDLVVVEEHHEAFYVWNHFAHTGRLGKLPWTLLHVDEHADLAIPRLRRSMESLNGLVDIARFTYTELSIDDFIWPAVYQGLFNRLFWMRVKHAPNAGTWRRVSIKAANGNTFSFQLTILAVGQEQECRIPTVEYAPVTTEIPLTQSDQLILDIDLDYFAWNSFPAMADLRLEVTENTYSEFLSNPYHYLRIAPGSKISAAREKGRHFLIYQGGGSSKQLPVTQFSEVERRLNEFCEYLIQCRIQPAGITVCRSMHSGYTDVSYSSFIERTLLHRLAAIYSTRVLGIQDLLPSPMSVATEAQYA